MGNKNNQNNKSSQQNHEVVVGEMFGGKISKSPAQRIQKPGSGRSVKGGVGTTAITETPVPKAPPVKPKDLGANQIASPPKSNQSDGEK